MRTLTSVFLLTLVVVGSYNVIVEAGTCDFGFMAEGQSPPAFDGINNAETGFASYFWAWGANLSDQGSLAVGLVDDGTGLAVNPGVLWANSDNCSGLIEGVALIVEAQTVQEGGKFAIIAIQGAEIAIDSFQTGTLQSVAETIPIPSLSAFAAGNDGFGEYVDFNLQWTIPSGAWALSDVADVLAGFAVYFMTSSSGGPVNDGDKSLFTRVQATPDGAIPYITEDDDTDDGLLPASQTSCIVRVRPGEDHFFAISLIFDGSGEVGSDPQADDSAVETTFVGACSAPANGTSAIFIDDFESGDTSMWSAVEP